jgi:hypothetical protein
MQDEDKTKEQLIIELHELRERVAESKKDKEEHKTYGGTPCQRQS